MRRAPHAIAADASTFGDRDEAREKRATARLRLSFEEEMFCFLSVQVTSGCDAFKAFMFKQRLLSKKLTELI